MSANSDAEVVARSLVDPEHFGVLFDRHGDAVFGYFARRIARSEVADLTAETFRIAFDRRHRFNPDRLRARPWLYGIAANVLFHHQRAAARADRALGRADAADVRTSAPADERVADAVDAAATWPTVAAALDRLAPIDREALLLHAWEELTYPEVAVATEVPVGTVRSRINRARRQLRDHLASPEEPTDG